MPQHSTMLGNKQLFLLKSHCAVESNVTENKGRQIHTDSVDFLRLLKRAKGQQMNNMGERYWQYSSLAQRLITAQKGKI
jgi:hypothetical protein